VAYVVYRTDRHGKQADAAKTRKTMPISPTEPIYLRSFMLPTGNNTVSLKLTE